MLWKVVVLVNVTDDMELRLKDELAYLCNKYPNVAFNRIDYNGKHRKGKDYLFAVAGYITVPQNYDPNIIKQHKALLTPNRRFYRRNKDKYNIILTNGPMDSHNYYKLDRISSYDERVNGICALNRIYKTGKPGDILWMREWFMNKLPVDGRMEKHCYGKPRWGGRMYQGHAVDKDPSCNHANHIANLEVLQRYRFFFAPEALYHELWSYDWVTERLWNAFKAKTVPVYYGCYNIEEVVPKDLYIDYRDFGSLKALAEHLVNFDKQRWIDMTEKAYDWYYNECQISKMSDLEKILETCT
jgi:hypothetical protein